MSAHPPIDPIAARLYEEFAAAVARRTRFGRVERADARTVRVREDRPVFAAPDMGHSRRGPGGAQFSVCVLDADHFAVEIGALGTARFGCAGRTSAQRAGATMTEAIEWLDAVLDGRVREVFVVDDGQCAQSRVSITWRDGTYTRLATIGVSAAERKTHQRLRRHYPSYAKR